MSDHKRQRSDADAIEELLAIEGALATVARNAPSDQIVIELAAIRAELHELAATNARLGGRLAASLDTDPPDVGTVSAG